MSYEAPEIRELKVNMEVNQSSSEHTSCDGGHCVKTRYGQDH